MKKYFYLFFVLLFVFSTTRLTAYKIKPKKVKKIKKMAVLPFCPVKKKSKSKKYKQLSYATSLIVSYKYRKFFKVNNKHIKVYSYKKTRNILEKNGKEWKCYKKDDIPALAKLLKVDAILYGTLIMARKKNESDAFDYVLDRQYAVLAETIRIRIKFKIRDKNGKLIVLKKIDYHHKGSLLSNKLDESLNAQIFKNVEVKDKYKVYFPEIFGATTEFYNWLWDKVFND